MEKRTNKMGIDNQKTSFEHQSLEVSMLDKDNFSDEELDSYLSKGEIKATDKVTIPPKILFVGDCTIATFGNFSASTGKAKSKKTFNISAMVAAAVTNTTVLNNKSGYVLVTRKSLTIFRHHTIGRANRRLIIKKH